MSDNSSNASVTRAEHTFLSPAALKLCYQSWVPESIPKAVIIIVHGIAEHIGRYQFLGEHLASRGFAVYGYDHRGHGRSQGRRCYVDSFSEYIADLEAFVTLVRACHPTLKLFLYGQSMGGAISLLYILEHPMKVSGLILSSAAIKPGKSVSPVLITAGRILAVVAPGTGTIFLDAAGLSRDPVVVQSYTSDPLVYQGKIPARTGYELIVAMRRIAAHTPDLHLPLLVMHGTADRLTNPEGSRTLFEHADSSDKTLKLLDGCYHELLNEPCRSEVLETIESWLKERC